MLSVDAHLAGAFITFPPHHHRQAFSCTVCMIMHDNIEWKTLLCINRANQILSKRIWLTRLTKHLHIWYPALSVRHPGILCADCEDFNSLPLLPATPWYRCSHDGHSRDGLHLITSAAQGEESGTEIGIQSWGRTNKKITVCEQSSYNCCIFIGNTQVIVKVLVLLSVISWVSAVEGCSVRFHCSQGVPVSLHCSFFPSQHVLWWVHFYSSDVETR